MQIRLKVACIASLSIIGLLVLVQAGLRTSRFIHIFGSHAGVALTQQQILDAHTGSTPDERPQVVPKIIHQIFHNWKNPGNNTLPADWEKVRQTCIEHNPDWEYRLWTEKESRQFIEKEYPWFLDIYDGYKLPVQRVDSLKYFVMRFHGGIYLDLDNGCLEDLTPLLYYPTWVTDGGHGALSNNILGAEPNHPFWYFITDSLKSYAWNYPFPYMTVHYGSGQWYETAVWEEYHRQLSGNGTQALQDGQLHRVMMDMRPGSAPWIFFTQARGGTWDNWDNHLFGWIGSHVPLVAFGGGAAILFLLSLCTCVWWRVRRNQGYSLLTTQPKEENID